MRPTASLVVCLTLLLAAGTSAQAPFPGAVRINGDWVPCDHPMAIAAGSGCVATAGATAAPAPPTDSAVLLRAQTGAIYEHRAAGWQIYVMGVLQRRNGDIIFIAEVVKGTDRAGRELFDEGDIFEIAPYLNAEEWERVPH
jgi:hypothetical protein